MHYFCAAQDDSLKKLAQYAPASEKNKSISGKAREGTRARHEQSWRACF